jgi:hypothetical protein
MGFSVRNSAKSRSRQTDAAGAADVDDREDDESGSFEFFGLLGPEDHTRDENKMPPIFKYLVSVPGLKRDSFIVALLGVLRIDREFRPNRLVSWSVRTGSTSAEIGQRKSG